MTSAEVYLWGTRIGVVYQESLLDIPVFSYDADFIKSGINPSPIMMPLNRQRYVFPGLSQETFHGLPGLLADSLPDKFGTKLIERYLADQGRNINSFSAVERLLYTGTRGMGALEYFPATDYALIADDSIDLSALVDLASRVLTDRQAIQIKNDEHTMEQIINVGTSAGGARAKAVVAWNPKTDDIRSGQVDAGSGYEYWLIKFDGVSNNKDKGDKEDPVCYTRIEYAYYLMAKNAGITMSDCKLYYESNRYHFMTKRFDRAENGEKIHMQTLGAIAHYDYNMPGAHSYEQAYGVMCGLGLGQDEAEQLFKRMVFNVYAKNHDDHVKNLSFLMDKSGRWHLSPAYDITYAYDPTNMWLSKHQMTINGKTEGFSVDDFLTCGKRMNLTRANMLSIIGEVVQAIDLWEEYAKKAFLGEQEMEYVKKMITRR